MKRYKPSEAFERFWRGWHPQRRTSMKPPRTYEGCELVRGWHLWRMDISDFPAPAAFVKPMKCYWCGMNPLQVWERRDIQRAIDARKRLDALVPAAGA